VQPENSTERASDDNPLETAARNFARQDAIAFDSSDAACKSKDPKKTDTRKMFS
jgi:hypothetical protein